MDFTKARFWVTLAAVVVACFILYQFWQWEVERIEVPKGKFLIRTHRWGKNLAENQIVAPDDSYKGVILEPLAEGRHFLNPIFWSYSVEDMLQVPPGKCLVLTRLYGKDIPKQRLAEGDILAQGKFPIEEGADVEDVERGILGKILGPGSYRLNRHAYDWNMVDAVEVRVDQVGVRTLKVGKDPRDLPLEAGQGRWVVPDGYRGVQKEPVPLGTYYLNPYVETIVPVEVRSHRVELKDIQFPSRDGFILKPVVFVEYRVQPDQAPQLLVRLTDEGKLHQEDSTPEEQSQNEIMQKIILPHIRGYARIEGSNFDARDFVITTIGPGEKNIANNREKLQKALLAKVKPRCLELGIEIRAVTLADMVPPKELADQISERELARVEQEKNKVRLGQYQAEQKLKAAETLKDQAKQKVEAQTRLIQAKTKAEQRLQVEESRLKQELANAELKLDAARKQAEATLLRGKADASVINLQNEADVAGLRKSIQGFNSANHFAQYQVLKKLAPALAEIFAAEDSDFAKVFSAYMTPIPATAKPAAGAVPGVAQK